MIDKNDIPWAGHVRSCIDGEWLVVLDLRGDRYLALPRPDSIESVMPSLRARGLIAGCIRPVSPLNWRDWISIFDAALWAARIVRSGRLDRAFSWISKQSARASVHDAAAVEEMSQQFDAMRIWIPRPYVCLFNSLCLIRFMLRRGVSGEVVFGVRARPFAAHCWVEASGLILDAGGEDCSTFAQIARV